MVVYSGSFTRWYLEEEEDYHMLPGLEESAWSEGQHGQRPQNGESFLVGIGKSLRAEFEEEGRVRP